MVHIMEGVVERGTATVLRDLDRPMFGKTGTTSGPTNVWFVGGTPEVVAGVYLGYDQPRPMGGYAQGGRVAAPVFKQFAQIAFKDMPKIPFVAPPGIRMVRIDRATRQARLRYLPDDGRSQILGDLGGVPARDRAAPLLPPQRRAGQGADRKAAGIPKCGRPTAPRPAAFAQYAGRQRRILAKAGRDLLTLDSDEGPNRGNPISSLFLAGSRLRGDDELKHERRPMRAEAQAHIDQINAATALLRRFLDWDKANRRLGELNDKVEDPTLWDDPKAAQDVMRERRRLEEAIGATRKIETELKDTVELIEMAEAEGDVGLVDDGVRALGELADRAERDKVAALLAGEADANNSYVEVNSGRRRHRVPTIGPACCSACIRAGPSGTG